MKCSEAFKLDDISKDTYYSSIGSGRFLEYEFESSFSRRQALLFPNSTL